MACEVFTCKLCMCGGQEVLRESLMPTELLPGGEEGGGEGGGGRDSADGRVVALHGVLGLSYVLGVVGVAAGAVATTVFLLQRRRIRAALLLLQRRR